MKIKYLWISKYKNISDLKIHFKADLISLLVGRNGLGKSNLIEILALVFRDLDMLNKEEEFLEWPYDPNHFEYEMHYECKNSDLILKCRDGAFIVQRKQLGTENDFEPLSFKTFNSNKKEEYLPKYIIGYYSGENNRIREIIRPYKEEIWSDLKKNRRLEEGFRPMFFAENFHSQIILLTILLYRFSPPNDKFLDRLDKLIKDFTSFSKLEEFKIILKNPEWFKRDSKELRKTSIELIESNLLAKDEDKIEFPFWGAKGKANKIISFLYDNNIGQPIYYYDDTKKLEFLELNLDKDKVSSKISKEFGHPSNFLDALDSLYAIDTIYEIELKVKSEKRDSEFDFSSLSEGEMQIISVLGLILITGKDDCLFLLDEPDTHLNPQWQRSYVDLLDKFNINNLNSHIIVATHSPLLVQASKNADVITFREKEVGKVEVVTEDFKIPNWSIDNVLLSKYFKLESIRPKYLDELIKKRKEIIHKGELSDKDLQEIKKYENEIGYLPTGDTIEELKSMLYINQMAKQLKDGKN